MFIIFFLSADFVYQHIFHFQLAEPLALPGAALSLCIQPG